MTTHPKQIPGVFLVILLAIPLNFALFQACFAKEPKLVKKQVAVIEMMEQFRETGSGFVLTESEVTPIPEERFLWSVAKLMSAECGELITTADKEAISEAHADVRRYLARAKMISADKEMIQYYEGLDKVFLVVQNLIDNLDENAIQARRKRQEERSGILLTGIQHTVASAGSLAASGVDPYVATAGGVWSGINQIMQAEQRAENALSDKNRQAMRTAGRTIQEIAPVMEALERKLDTKFRWEKYIGASDSARDQKKAWENQDFMMMILSQASDIYSENPTSADGFADCVYSAMLVPHDKVYDEFRAVTLAVAYDAVIQMENYSPAYPVECLKLCLCFTDDSDGAVRQQLMFCLADREKYQEAVSLAVEIKVLRQNDLDFCWVLTLALSELKEYDVAIDWFRQMVKNAEDVSSLRSEPLFAKLQNAKPKEYFEAITPKYSWTKTLGFVRDEFTMTNNSPFPLHDVSLTVTLSDGKIPWVQTFQAAYIAPNQSVKWDSPRGHVRNPTSSTATMKCRQNGQYVTPDMKGFYP